MAQETTKKWHILQSPKGDAKKIAKFFEENGAEETYVPMRKIGADGKKVPVSSNMILVKDSHSHIFDLLEKGDPTKFAFDTNGNPITLEDETVRSFIQIAENGDKDCIFLDPRRDNVKHGDMVRVVDGKYAGISGEYLRVRSNRCVVVRLGSLCAVATGFVKPEQTEKI